MRVVLVSLNQIRGDKAENRRRIEHELEAVCARTGSCAPDLVIFPEMTLTGYTMRAEMFGEAVGGPEGTCGSPTLEFFGEMARKTGSAMAFGMIVKEPDGAFTNNLAVVDKQGNFVTRYQKIHPFSFAGEDKYFRGGEKPGVFHTGDWTIGLTVCYDLRFCELYQALSRSCDCIINIANWPCARVAHWRTLLQARAIENQCYILGVNRTGTDAREGRPATAENTYEKSSLAVNPLGEILTPQPLTEISDLYEMDLASVARTRTAFPFKNDRRPEVYQSII